MIVAAVILAGQSVDLDHVLQSGFSLISQELPRPTSIEQPAVSATEHIVVSVELCEPDCRPFQIRVWDGDTFRLGRTSNSETIRISNIDAPEIERRCDYETNL